MCVYFVWFSETGQWTPGSPWTSRWKFVLTVYVCAPADMHSAVNSFMEVWRVVCVGGYMCVYIHVQPSLSPCFFVLHSLQSWEWLFTRKKWEKERGSLGTRLGNGWVSGYHCVFVCEVRAIKKSHINNFCHQDHLPLLTQQCREGGCYLTVVHMNTDTMAQVTVRFDNLLQMIANFSND